MEAHYVKFLIDKVCEEEIRRENLMKKLATLKNPPSTMKEVQLKAYQAQIDEPYNKTLMTDESIIFRGRELTIPRSRSYIYSLLLDSSSYPKELKDLYNSGTSFDDANIYVYLGTVGEINSKGKLVNQVGELTQSNSNLFSSTTTEIYDIYDERNGLMYKKFRSLEDPRTLITIPINTKELLRFETSKNIIFNQNHHTPQDFAKMRDEYLHELIDINQNAAFEYLQESFQIFDPGVQKVRK